MKVKKSTLKLVVLILIAVICVLAVYFSFPAIFKFIKYIVGLFMPFILGYLFSVVVKPLVTFMEKQFKIPRVVSAVIVMVLLLGVIGGLITLVVYRAVDEVKNIYNQLDVIIAEISKMRISLEGMFERMPQVVQDSVSAFLDDVLVTITGILSIKSAPLMSSAGGLAAALPKILVSFIAFILSSFFMVCDFEIVSRTIDRVFKLQWREKLFNVRMQLKKYLGGYIKAQLAIMSVAFLIMLISFAILDVKYGALVAAGIALFDALPFFGSGAVLWPWSIISFINGDLKLGFGCIITYVVIFLVRQLIEPKIVSKNIGMHPILTLMSMYIGYRVLSIGGMILGPIIMLTVISFYRAGVFDGIFEFFKTIWFFIKKEINSVKAYVKKLWESE